MAAKTVPRGLLGGLGPSLGALGPSGGGLGPLLGALGPSWDGLGGLLGRLEGVLGALGPSWNGLGGLCGYQRVVLGCFGIRFVDSIHRFDLLMRFVDSIRSLDRSVVLHHVVNSLSTQQLGPAECAKRFNNYII